MANKELIEEVGKYIDKYYDPSTDEDYERNVADHVGQSEHR